MPRRLTEEQLKYIKAHVNDFPRKEVAEKAGITVQTLHRYINRYGAKKKCHKLSKETIAKIQDLYITMTAKEISEKLNIPKATIQCLVCKHGFKHNEKTLDRISRERRKPLSKYWNEERYAEKGMRMHIMYKMDEIRVMSGMPQKTRLRMRKLTNRALNAKMYLKKKYNYFYSKGEPFVLCFDEDTKRSKREQYYTEKFGFQFINSN